MWLLVLTIASIAVSTVSGLLLSGALRIGLVLFGAVLAITAAVLSYRSHRREVRGMLARIVMRVRV